MESFDAVPQNAIFLQERSVLERLRDHELQLVHLEGLQNVIVSTHLHRLDRVFGGGEGGDYNHLGRGVNRLHFLEDIHARAAAEPQIRDDEIELILTHALQGTGIVGLHGHLIALLAQQDLEKLAHGALVVDDEDGGHSPIVGRVSDHRHRRQESNLEDCPSPNR